MLLIDADLRRPRLASALNLPNRRGLSDMLSGSSGFDPGLVQKVAGLDSLFLPAKRPARPQPGRTSMLTKAGAVAGVAPEGI